jgi:hypothetical protein
MLTRNRKRLLPPLGSVHLQTRVELSLCVDIMQNLPLSYLSVQEICYFCQL